jgi:AcrR family transcriptional regulator
MSELPQPPSRPRPARKAGRPRGLDRDAVVDASLRVLDAEGLDAVTFRRVAEELGTSATALYTYVRDKEQLVDLLLDRVIGEVDLGVIDPAQPWQEQMRQIGRAMRRTLGAHGDIARATLGRIPQGENALVLLNEMLGRLRAAQLPERVISYGVDVLSLYTGAIAYEESLAVHTPDGEASIEEFVEQLRSYFASLPADRFPHVIALAGPLTAFDPESDDRFEFGLDVIIDGLAAQAARSVDAPPPSA